MSKPTMHAQTELLADLGYDGFLPDATLFKWFQDGYSLSKHLLTLYSIARGLGAKLIVEIGFGRSSFVLARAAHENGGRFFSCDERDFTYLLSPSERKVTTFVHGRSDELWAQLEGKAVDFAFLDYFSSDDLTSRFIEAEMARCLDAMKTNGVMSVHDSIGGKYQVGQAIGRLQSLTKRRSYEVVSLPYNYGLAIVRKTAKSPHGVIMDNYPKKEVGG